jgi:hypothetical protein
MTAGLKDPQDTAEKLSDAVAAVGLTFLPSSERADSGPDGYLLFPGGHRVAVQLKSSSLLSSNGLRERLRTWGRSLPTTDTIGVVVANRITDDARAVLREAGWGWLDLRGHLRLASDGLLVDVNVTPQEPKKPRSEPFAGKVGIEVASAMLLDPDKPVAIRPIANAIGRAPSSVSEAVVAFRRAGLITSSGLPRTPELFWELASAWKPEDVDVATLPQGPDLLAVLRVKLHELDEIGWALSDARAAAVYGAPLAIRSDHPPTLYVPDLKVLRRSVQLLGPASDRASRAASLRAAPTAIVCSHRQDPVDYADNGNSEFWPMTRPLFVALDLAQDPGRGKEILKEWTPPEPWNRVW